MLEDQQTLHTFVYSEEVVTFVRAANETATFFEDSKENGGQDIYR